MFLKQFDIRTIAGLVFVITGLYFIADLDAYMFTGYWTSEEIFTFAYILNVCFGLIMISSLDPLKLDSYTGERWASTAFLINLTMMVHTILITAGLYMDGSEHTYYMGTGLVAFFLTLGFVTCFMKTRPDEDEITSTISFGAYEIAYFLMFAGAAIRLLQIIFVFSGSKADYQEVLIDVLTILYVITSYLTTMILMDSMSEHIQQDQSTLGLGGRIAVISIATVLTFLLCHLFLKYTVGPVGSFFEEAMDFFQYNLRYEFYNYLPHLTYIGAALGCAYGATECLANDRVRWPQILRMTFIGFLAGLAGYAIILIIQAIFVSMVLAVVIVTAVIVTALAFLR